MQRRKGFLQLPDCIPGKTWINYRREFESLNYEEELC